LEKIKIKGQAWKKKEKEKEKRLGKQIMKKKFFRGNIF
jgi:hypothetical protein